MSGIIRVLKDMGIELERVAKVDHKGRIVIPCKIRGNIRKYELYTNQDNRDIIILREIKIDNSEGGLSR